MHLLRGLRVHFKWLSKSLPHLLCIPNNRGSVVIEYICAANGLSINKIWLKMNVILSIKDTS